uniref:Uncharacterized protein n=1 Tax=Cacopsylla melanoneura TaxID=428564 RepID=A0A8D8T2L1_9HEMI
MVRHSCFPLNRFIWSHMVLPSILYLIVSIKLIQLFFLLSLILRRTCDLSFLYSIKLGTIGFFLYLFMDFFLNLINSFILSFHHGVYFLLGFISSIGMAAWAASSMFLFIIVNI